VGRSLNATVPLDLVGGQNSRRSLTVLRSGGLLISVPSGMDPELRAAGRERGIRVTDFQVESDQVGLAGLAGLADSGQLQVLVSREFPLARAAAAQIAVQTAHPPGKVVVLA
jgi:NADPH:quinone reductase-like Zn-dependent oxidoreductase